MTNDVWRGNRPAEDPAKIKRWGMITARPSEYLVHVRAGRIRERSSGQGASCFKWPWDSVAIVPTSLQTLQFQAEQVTRERVGVSVVGLAVYRIADPLLAYRVLNFSFPERAQQKLEHTLTGMFEGASRRLVATLTVDECLEQRKEALATELLREVAPVVGGQGRPDDPTATGWGVVLDTIEIQDVRVLSEKVFLSMQAPYRAALDRRAREASVAAEQAIAEREAQARIDTRLRAMEHARTEAEAELAAHALQMEALARRTERAHAELKTELARRKELTAMSRLEGEAEAELALARARADQVAAEARARVLLAENLPALAGAVGQRFGEVNVTQIGGDAFGTVARAMSSILELARS